VTRGPWLVVFALLAAGTACRSPEPRGKAVLVMPADLACSSDADCTIRDADLGCCCSCSACIGAAEPFAISTRANAVWEKDCAGAVCTMDACENPAGHRVQDFRAVCVNRACERRAKR